MVSEDTESGDRFWATDPLRGFVYQDVNSPEELAMHLDKKTDCECVTTLNVSGHGTGGVGVNLGREPFNIDMSQAIADKIRCRLCMDAVVILHTCGYEDTPEQLLEMANKLGRKVCAFHGACRTPFEGTSAPGYKAPGKWWCANPTNGFAPLCDFSGTCEGQKE